MNLKLKNIILFCLFQFLLNGSIISQNINELNINSKQDFENAMIVYKNILNHNFFLSDYFKNSKEAINYYENVLVWAKSNSTTTDVIHAKNCILGFYINVDNQVEIIARIRDLLKYDEVYRTYLVRDLYYELKRAYRKTERFNDFLKIIPDYHKYSLKYGYKLIGEENYDCEIAFVNYSLKNYEIAIQAYKKCAKSLEEEEKYFPQSSTINNIGLCFSKIRAIDSATIYYNKAIEIVNKHKKLNKKTDYNYENHFINVIESNIVSLTADKKSLNEILPYYKKELKTAKSFNEKNIISSAYYNIADIYYINKNTNLSSKYLDSVFYILDTYNNSSIKKKSLNLKAKLLLIQNDFEKANRTFKKYELYVDSLDSEKAKKDYLIGVIQHETDVRTKELEQSRITNEEERKTIQYQWIGLSFLGILLIVSIIFFLIHYSKNQIIKKQKENLDEALKEKEVLLKEIHHRVKNNLQVVSGLLLIQSKKKNNNSFDEIMEQSQRQIQSMSLVHEMLYQKENLTKIQIENYIKKLSKNLMSAYPQKNIKLKISSNDTDMHIDFANPIGLIVNELITNSLKHGFKNKNKGKIDIKINKIENEYEFIYSDNGQGISAIKTSDKKTHFGNRLITTLAEEISATIEMKNEKGLTYIFKFKQKE